MDPNFNQEEYASIQKKFKQLFIIRDKLEKEKKEVEKIIEDEKHKEPFLKRFTESKRRLETLQEALGEINRKNILLQEFLAKSDVNQDKNENDQIKIETLSEVVEEI